MPPRVVVFDLGKVLLDFDYGIAVRKLQSAGRLTFRELLRFIDQSPLLFRYETGLLTTGEFFAELREASGFRGSLDEFSDLFGDIFSPIDPMIELHARLRGRGVPTFILSNTNELAIRHIRRRFAFFRNFDGYVLSYEHGAMKPDAKLYEVIEQVSGRQGAELLYIDDRPENVAAGAARGWQSILHEDPEKTRVAVQRSGVLDHCPWSNASSE